MATVHQSLPRDFSRQDEQFSSPFSILRQAIAAHVSPAASIAVTHRGHLIALKSFGKFVYESELAGAPSWSLPVSERQSLPGASEASPGRADSEVYPSTPFDLASLTKAIATTTMAANLYERGSLDLDVPIAGTIPEFLVVSNGDSSADSSRDSIGARDPRREGITFRMLLAHSSGLPAYERLFLRCHSRDDLLRAAFATPLTTDPGARAEYSDIGFIILGVALERIAGETLDRFCQREVFGPLGMVHTTFNPPQDLRNQIPPTADERNEARSAETLSRAEQESHETPTERATTAVDARSTFRNRIIQGEVQDENAFVLGGVAGHAGLFSTAEDLAIFARAMLNGGSPILRAETVRLFTQRQSSPPHTSRALGWDTPSHPSQSGKYFGPQSFGHLGYTGTSLWIDPERELSITLLTNRTWPDCSNQAIKKLRPQFHDAIVEALRER